MRCCAKFLQRREKQTLFYLCGFLTPPVEGADLRAALVASCLRGAFPPVDFLAVCLVLAMVTLFEWCQPREKVVGIIYAFVSECLRMAALV